MDLVNRCCLIDNNEKCERVAGNAAYNKRIQRNVAQKKLKLHIDAGVSTELYVAAIKMYFKFNLASYILT